MGFRYYLGWYIYINSYVNDFTLAAKLNLKLVLTVMH